MVLDRLTNHLWLLCFLPLFLLCSIRLYAAFPALLRRSQRWTLEWTAAKKEGLSASQAVSATLAATVGTGNIVGTAQAIAMGGPGALFWIWIAAILGLSVKTAEIWFGLHGRAGPMGYISAVLGRGAAKFYAAVSCVSVLLVGNMAQMNAAVCSLSTLLPGKTMVLKAVLGLLLSAFLARGLSGGSGTAGKVCSFLVPVMTLLFLGFSCGALILRRFSIAAVLKRIMRDAFTRSSVIGAVGGISIRNALLWGLRRGSFSNEAGLGTAASVHAYVNCASPDRHALCGILEVSVDTLVLCTISGLVILCSGVGIPFGSLPGPELMQQAFSTVYGEALSAVVMAFSLSSFGFSTTLGCYLIGCRAAKWIKLDEDVFRMIYILFAFLAGMLSLKAIWLSADLINVMLAVPNLLALFLLAPLLGSSKKMSAAEQIFPEN